MFMKEIYKVYKLQIMYYICQKIYEKKKVEISYLWSFFN